jgi:anti-sigma-K factor RskA
MNRPEQPNDLCADLMALIPAYAIGATDRDETVFVERNLDACPEARQALDDFRELADQLRAEAPPVAPPPALEAKIMAAARMAKPLPAAPVVPAVVARPKTRTSGWPLVAGLAAAVALIVFAVSSVYWSGRVNGLNELNTALARRLAENQSALSIVSASGGQSLGLADAASGELSSVRLFFVPQTGESVLLADGLNPLPQDRTYQVWLLQDGQPVSVGVFGVDETGRGDLLFTAPQSMTAFDIIAITEEPAGGSPQPTSNPLLVGTI